MPIKICVYAICKNESKFIDAWLDNMSEADYIVVLDTGSTDGSYERLSSDPRVTKVIRKNITPWRFDVARNESMKLVPDDADVLVCTDFDERFDKGWADVIRSNWGEGKYNRARYVYVWGTNEMNEPADVFFYDKITTRDYHWKYPVHEILTPNDGIEERRLDLDQQIVLRHYPDLEKSRASYPGLIKMGAEELPEDPHARYLYARELLTTNKLDEALEEFKAILGMPDIRDESHKAQYYACLVSCMSIYLAKKDYSSVVAYGNELIAHDDTYFEPYLFIAEVYNALDNYEIARAYAKGALVKCHRHYHWFELPYTFLGWPQEILAVSYAGLGDIDSALEYIKEPLKHYPNDLRLLKKENALLKMKLRSIEQSKNPA